jgi:hypothetical protein
MLELRVVRTIVKSRVSGGPPNLTINRYIDDKMVPRAYVISAFLAHHPMMCHENYG